VDRKWSRIVMGAGLLGILVIAAIVYLINGYAS
jgi:hypothetical protein